MKNLTDQLKKTVVFIGEADGSGKVKINPQSNEPMYFATGMLMNVNDTFHLITAKHVVVKKAADGRLTNEIQDENLSLFFNLKTGGIASRSIKEIKSTFKVEWIFHENSDIDIAIIPFGLNEKTDDVKTLQKELFYEDEIAELLDVFYLAYQPGTKHINRISPIFRVGTISLINEDETFYIDGSAFPGNSGCPVFIKPSVSRYDKDGNWKLGGDSIGGKFLGIVGEYLPYVDVAFSMQTNRARVRFEENTSLSKIWPIKFIDEIIASEDFIKQSERFKVEEAKEKVGI